MATKTAIVYTFSFDRIGRRHEVAPLDVKVTVGQEERDEIGDYLAEQVYRYARPFLLSRDVEVVVDLEKREVSIFAGFHNAGGGRFERREVA